MEQYCPVHSRGVPMGGVLVEVFFGGLVLKVRLDLLGFCLRAKAGLQ